MARPFGTRLISRSRMPSSGGLTRSSAELMASSGALIFSRSGAGIVVARRLERVEDVVGVVRSSCSSPTYAIDDAIGVGERRARLSGAGSGCCPRATASAPPCGGSAAACVYSPSFHSGSLRIASMTIAPPHPVAAGDLRRQARERHQRVHEVRIALAPQPGVHAAHRRAHHEPQVVDAEALGDQPVLRLDHVVVAVARETARAGRRSACSSGRGRCRRAG